MDEGMNRKVVLEMNPAQAELLARVLEEAAGGETDSPLGDLDPDGKWSWVELSSALLFRASQLPEERQPIMVGAAKNVWPMFIVDTVERDRTYAVLPNIPEDG